MADIKTNFAGLELKSPIIVGASGLTGSTKHLKDFEQNGAGAIVLKSIFEEEIVFEYNKFVEEAEKYGYDYEFIDYFDYKIKQDNLDKYISLIEEAKKTVNIPVIASINCITPNEWTYFTKRIKAAGADALELNIFILPSDLNKSSEEIENIYFKVVEEVKKEVDLPVIVKMSYFFTNLGQMIIKLSEKADGLVLFNRFYNPDIDINARKIVPASIFTSPNDIVIPLRWVAITSGRVKSSLAASTGIHDGTGLIKILLAGADAVEIVSTIYKNGAVQIKKMLDDLELYMNENNFSSLSELKGLLSQKNIKNPGLYERVQFMRYFSDYNEEL
jgi:dihydroorotate dehydrogenase (fumarate)